jgi:hypothetical protein
MMAAAAMEAAATASTRPAAVEAAAAVPAAVADRGRLLGAAAGWWCTDVQQGQATHKALVVDVHQSVLLAGDVGDLQHDTGWQ